jgi:cytochrome P450
MTHDASTTTVPDEATDIAAAYNPFDQAFLDDPRPVYARIQREAPVCYSDLFESWLITRYDDIVDALDAGRLVARSDNAGPPPAPEVTAELARGCPHTKLLYESEGEEYVRLRSLVEAALSPELIASFEPRLRAAAHDLVDAFQADGCADLVAQFAAPFADTTILDFVGVPPSDRRLVRAWNEAWAALFIPGQPLEQQIAGARAVVAYERYNEQLIEARRREPRNDLVTALVEARVEGVEPLAVPEVVGELMELTGVAGNTAYGLANVLVCFVDEPGFWQDLRRRPDLLPAAVEEGLRVESPVLGSAREAATTFDVGGATIPKGAPVLVAYAAANHDDSAFAEPARFDAARANAADQLTMGRGRHACVGARLARTQIRIAVEVLLERLPDMRRAEELAPTFEAPFPFLRAVSWLPAVWDGPRS